MEKRGRREEEGEKESNWPSSSYGWCVQERTMEPQGGEGQVLVTKCKLCYRDKWTFVLQERLELRRVLE